MAFLDTTISVWERIMCKPTHLWTLCKLRYAVLDLDLKATDRGGSILETATHQPPIIYASCNYPSLLRPNPVGIGDVRGSAVSSRVGAEEGRWELDVNMHVGSIVLSYGAPYNPQRRPWRHHRPPHWCRNDGLDLYLLPFPISASFERGHAPSTSGGGALGEEGWRGPRDKGG
jgi:hypothetical protein